MQKSIRRGLEREALYWASELDLAGFPAYVWKRLRIVASEDVGLASTETVIAVRALNDNWLELRKAKDQSGSERLHLLHAVMLLCRAPKSRIVDHAYMVVYEGERVPIAVPDFALDKHTGRGRRMGRGEAHFFDEAARLENAAELEDPYAEEGRKARSRRGH